MSAGERPGPAGPGPKVVARSEETVVLDSFVAGLEAGFAALVLAGGPGIGKTTLWRYAAARAAEGQALVLAATPSAAEAQLAFAGLGDLLRPHFDALAEQLPGPQRRALAAALMLSDPEDAASAAHGVAAGLLGCLQALARDRPVLVSIDDVQWLDASSAAAIAFAARRLRGEPVGLLLGHRTEEPCPLPLGLDRAPDPDRVQVIDVAPLSFGAVHALVQLHAGPPPPRPVLRQIHEASGGNPLFALELARAIRDAGGGTDPGRPLPVPGTVQELVADRVRQLPDSTQLALTAAAALAEPTLAKLGRFEPASSPEASLRPAAEARLIELDGERIRFVHPVYAAAVYGLADAAARRDVHRRLAEAADDADERAAHLALATDRPDAAVARELADAAARAAARGAPEAAAALSGHALRLMPAAAGAARAAIALGASDYAFAAGDTGGARRLLEALLDSEDPELRAQALVRLCTLATFDGSVAEAHGLAGRALEEPVKDLSLAVRIHRRAAMVSMVGPNLPEAEATGARAVELAEQLGDPGVLASALGSLAFLKSARRSDGWEAALERALALEQSAGSGLIDDSPSAQAGLIAMAQGDLRSARRYLEAARADAVARGGDPLATGLLMCLSERASRGGEFAEALALAERGLVAAEQSGQHLQRSGLLYAKALAAAHLGREAEARSAATEGLEISTRSGQVWAQADNLWALGVLDLSLGRAEEALASLTQAVEIPRNAGARELAIVPAHGDAIEAALAAGDRQLAGTLQDELEAGAHAAWMQAVALRTRGLIEAADGQLEAAVATLAEAVAHGERIEDGAFALARARLALGAALRRTKRKRRGREELEAARAAFDALGAALWVRRADEELARIGGRAPSGDGLTPTERRVAELVAAGRTNKEVAAELFVTVRTVESNLTKVYAKLGVRSRVELPGALDGGRPAG